MLRLNRSTDDIPGRNFKYSLRVILILLYLVVQFSFEARFVFHPRFPGRTTPLAYTITGIFLLYGILEVMEYHIWEYTYKKRTIPVILFILRVLPVAIALPGIIHNYYMLNIFYTLLPLLVFYSYFAINYITSLIVTVTFAAGMILHHITFPMSSSDIIQTFFLHTANKVFIVLLFHWFAYFWDLDRKKEEENYELLKKNAEIELQLREYAKKVAHTIALEERTRMARDIHDSVGHALTAIQIQLQKARSFAQRDPAAASQAVAQAQQTAGSAMQDVRLSLSSMGSEKQPQQLSELIPSLVEQLNANDIKVKYTFEGSEQGYSYAVLLGLYRVIQESVTNILRHAEASEVEIAIVLGKDQGLVKIHDDGRGFDQNTIDAASSMGLKGISQRLELVRGTLEITSAPHKGTALLAVVPKDPVQLIGV